MKCVDEDQPHKVTLEDQKGLPPDPTTKSGIPYHVVESLVRTFLPDIIAFYQTEEGRREFREWKEKQMQSKDGCSDQDTNQT